MAFVYRSRLNRRRADPERAYICVSRRRVSYRGAYFTGRASQRCTSHGRACLAGCARISWAGATHVRAFHERASHGRASYGRVSFAGMHLRGLHLIGGYISQNVHLRWVYLMGMALPRGMRLIGVGSSRRASHRYIVTPS
jgi:hypothetical protein